MNKLNIVLLIIGLLNPFVTTFSQQQKTDLQDFVIKNTFEPNTIDELRSMNDGSYYTILEENGTKISKYAYSKDERMSVIADIPKLKETPIQSISGYKFSKDETKILVYTNEEKIYRHSFKANYYIIDIERREIEILSENGKQQAAAFAPDGHKVAFVRDNNLFIKNLRFKTETAVTSDGEENNIINGIPDWVYEEEFSFTRAFDWSPNSEELAFIRFDESDVKTFSFPVYKSSHPSYSENELYPGQYQYKYPKAGGVNSKVSVHVFNLRNRTTKKMDLNNEEDIYIPRIKWTTQPDQLAIITLNRRQNHLDLHIANPASGVTRVLFTDRNDKYISSDVLDNIVFLENGRHFIYVGELDGYNHIHLYGMDGRKIRQVTKGEWDVTKYLGYNNNDNLFYYQAAVNTPLEREIYSIRMDGTRRTKLSRGNGTSNSWFSSDYNYYINEFSDTQTPPVYTIFDNRQRKVRVIEDNQSLKDRALEYKLPKKEFFTFTTSQGISLNGYMIKPLNFDENSKYPVVMTQYSGPNSQRVLNQWGKNWEHYLATQGYLIVCVDGRGTGARGEEFRKQTYMQLGKLESNDQIETAKYLTNLPYVDDSRIGMWGWSYGGFMTALTMSKTDLIKTGISVAPVTHWKYYDTAYTERFMRMPRENPNGYRENAPLNLAHQLNGRLFLIHGTADDNVHFQNMTEYADKLIQENKQFDMFVYPNRNHSISGGNVRNHLYQMKFDYLERHLK